MPFAETMAALVAAHLIADFTFQPDWLVKAKGEKCWGLPLHIAIVLILSILFLGNVNLPMLLVIGISHLALDSIKIFLLPKIPKLVKKPDGVWPFAADQLAHIVFIVIAAAKWPSLFSDGWLKNPTAWGIPQFGQPTGINISSWYMAALVLVSGMILCVPVGGILIGKITNGMIDDDEDTNDDDEDTDEEDGKDDEAEEEEAGPADDDDVDETAIKRVAVAIETAAAAYTNSLSVDSISATSDESLSEQDEVKIENILRGLPDGGRYIGWLERILVMLFVLSGYPQGIGFLIATKSILRFGDIKNWHQRAATEYVIIGTFLSFAWAMVIAGLTQQALEIWFPPKPPTPTVINLASDGASAAPAASSNPITAAASNPAPTNPAPTNPTPTNPTPTNPNPATTNPNAAPAKSNAAPTNPNTAPANPSTTPAAPTNNTKKSP